MDANTAAVALMPVSRAAKRALDAGLTPTQAAYLKKLQVMLRAAMQGGMDARQAGIIREQMVVTYNHFKKARQADKKALALAAASVGKALMSLPAAASVAVAQRQMSPKAPKVPKASRRPKVPSVPVAALGAAPRASPMAAPRALQSARGTCPPGSPPPGKVCVRGFWKWRNAAARRAQEPAGPVEPAVPVEPMRA